MGLLLGSDDSPSLTDLHPNPWDIAWCIKCLLYSLVWVVRTNLDFYEHYRMRAWEEVTENLWCNWIFKCIMFSGSGDEVHPLEIIFLGPLSNESQARMPEKSPSHLSRMHRPGLLDTAPRRDGGTRLSPMRPEGSQAETAVGTGAGFCDWKVPMKALTLHAWHLGAELLDNPLCSCHPKLSAQEHFLSGAEVSLTFEPHTLLWSHLELVQSLLRSQSDLSRTKIWFDFPPWNNSKPAGLELGYLEHGGQDIEWQVSSSSTPPPHP